MSSKKLSLAHLIDGFKLSCQAEGKSPKTIEWYVSFLTRFRLFLEQDNAPVYVAHIDKTHIRSFIRYLQTEGRSLP